MKHRWDEMKYSMIQAMSSDELLKLPFREESYYNQLNKTAKIVRVKEASFKVQVDSLSEKALEKKRYLEEFKRINSAPIIPLSKAQASQQR